MNDADPNAGDRPRQWNSTAGGAWVEAQASIDRMFKPLEDLLVDEIAAGSPRRVLDVGCGTGATTLAAARRLGAQSECVGVDIAEPMITAARARAEREGTPAGFVLADAETHAFEPARFDAIMSRFGVMFFENPVRAFTSLRRATRAGAALRAVVWRSPEENPFMTTAERAAAPLVPNIPPRVPDAPGQFGFANAPHVRRILGESGWVGIEIRPVDVVCTFPATELTRYLSRFGPLGQVLPDLDEETRTRVVETVRAAFEPYVRGDDVQFDAACWMLSATAP